MIPKTFDKIGVDEINKLIEMERQEDSTIEYKQELPGSSEDEKKEFLCDVSAFANLNGGDIIYGITEKLENGKNTGFPEKAIGLKGINTNDEMRRLENLIQSRIVPPIIGCKIKSITDFDEGPVILIRILQSLLLPHAVKGKSKSFYFYIRDNGGKHPMDYDELQSAFEISGNYTERIRKFRFDRISNYQQYMPVVLYRQPTIWLHIVPLTAIKPGSLLDIQYLIRTWKDLKPMNKRGNGYPEYNFDGFYISGQPIQGNPGYYESYIQIFRNGSIESVTSEFFDENKRILAWSLEEAIIDTVNLTLSKYKQAQIQPPIFIMLSFIGIKSYELGIRKAEIEISKPQLRDNLFFPELVINDLDISVKEILHPLFDIFHQAFGFPKCNHYTDEGNRTAHG